MVNICVLKHSPSTPDENTLDVRSSRRAPLPAIFIPGSSFFRFNIATLGYPWLYVYLTRRRGRGVVPTY